ncbi:MAG: DUF3987 domain-containing protein [Phycisphaeraceae bacterium]
MSTPRVIANGYASQGWAPVPVPFQCKGPNLAGWQKLRIGTPGEVNMYFNGKPQNIGVLLGEPSGWLVDVDLDHPAAVALARDYLPPTEAVFGREGKPASHYLYRLKSPAQTVKFQTTARTMLAEFRSTGCQTIFPGSVHTSGEAIRWDSEGEPSEVDPAILLDALRLLAEDTAEQIGEPLKGQPMKPNTTMQKPGEQTGGDPERAWRYIVKVPDAISNQRGHDAAFRAACECFRFGLSDGEARKIMQRFNAEKCVPPWSERELDHKIDDARTEVDRKGEFGSRLRASNCTSVTDAPPQLPEVESDPPIIELSPDTLPEISPDVLPPWARDHARELSEAKEVSPTFATLMQLAVMATTVQSVFKVQIEGSYAEALPLMVAPSLASGERKTAIHGPITKPVFEHQAALRDAMAAAIKKATIKRRLMDQEIKTLERDYLKADPGDKERIEEQIADLTEQLPPIPQLPQIIVEDFTEAALGVALSANGESLLATSDEGGLFDNLAGRHKDMAEIDLFLKAHTGSPHTVNRTGRENLHLKRPLLSVAISPQPGVLSKLAGKEGFLDRGLVARFLWALPQSNVGTRKLKPASINSFTSADYHGGITAMAHLGERYAGSVRALNLTPEAYKAWKAFEHEVEPRIGPAGDLRPIKAWASKLPGAVARIAAVCHCGEHAEASPDEQAITLDQMERAIETGRQLIPHAIAAHRLMGGGGFTVAQEVVEHYQAAGWPNGVVRLSDWWRPVRRIVGETSRAFEPVAQILVDHSYLIECDPPEGKRGGPAGRWYRANAELFRYSVIPSSLCIHR